MVLHQIPECLFFWREHPDSYTTIYYGNNRKDTLDRLREEANWWSKKNATYFPHWKTCAEYFRSVKPRLLEGDLLNINFKETKNGKTRVVAIFAKRARGMMADYLIRNKVEKAEDIKKFKLGGYKFNKALSDDMQWTFERPQP